VWLVYRLCRSADEERVMTALYAVAGVIVLLLLAYLVVALIRPELFP
jgi:K+-transporting ATPase KdpF subunit